MRARSWPDVLHSSFHRHQDGHHRNWPQFDRDILSSETRGTFVLEEIQSEKRVQFTLNLSASKY